MKSAYFSLLFLLAAISSSVRASTIQSYSIRWVPMDEAHCQPFAATIAQEFARTTGLPILSVGCERVFTFTQTVVIQYEADLPARLVTTMDEIHSTQGTFPDKGSCESALPIEKRLFISNTGLDPVVAFCYPEGFGDDNQYRYVARIDGFGTATQYPYVFAVNLYETPALSEAQLSQLIQGGLSQMSTVRDVRQRVDISPSQSRVAIKYYSTRRRNLTLDTMTGFESLAECQRRKPGIEALLTEFGMVGTRTFCAAERSSPNVTLYHFGLTAGAYRLEHAAGSYGTRAACENGISTAVAQFSQSLDAPHARGFCSYEKSDLLSAPRFYLKVLLEI